MPQFLQRVTLSFYPFVTRRDLRMVLAIGTVFVVVVNVYRRSRQIKRLMVAISLIGVGIAGLAVYMSVTGATDIYGVVPVVHLNSGPFVNHSHFGQFMNLCIGAMVGLLLMRIAELTQGTTSFSDSYVRLSQGGFDFAWLLGGAIAWCAFMICYSMTRGGVISFLIAGAVTAILFALRGAGSRQGVLVVLVVAGLLGILFVAYQPIYHRMITLRHASGDSLSRRQIIADLSKLWAQFPIFGTGLGTHKFVFPMFDSSTNFAQAMHAENEYAELMEETGALGMALCLMFVAIIFTCYLKSIWNPNRPVQYGAFGLGMGLLAILIHSFSDFGQHLPINAFLTCVFCGLLINMARMGHSRVWVTSKQSIQQPVLRTSRALRIAVTVAVVAIFALPLREARAATRSFFAFSGADALQDYFDVNGWEKATLDDIFHMIRSAAAAASQEPDDASIGFYLSDFRWRAMSRSLDSQGRIVLTPQEVGFTGRVADDLDAIRPLCPTFSPPDQEEGWLRENFGDKARGEALIRLAYRLDKNYPATCYSLAEMDSAEGKWNDALNDAHRAIELGAVGFSTEVRVVVRI